jgi:type II secretory pathway component PulK
VLVLTLVILALAVTVTAGVCRSSLAKAERSVRAANDLQRRWAAVSCKRAFLPNAETVLAAAEATRGQSLVSCQARLTLGGQTIDLVFADETAKLNVNDVVRRRGKAQAEASVAALVREGGTSIRTRLLAGKPQAAVARPAKRVPGRAAPEPPPDPQPADDNDEPDARPLQSFGQVFPDSGPAALFGHAGLFGQAARPGPAAAVTCWGDGRLHFRRAPDAVLARACVPPLTAAQAGRLVRLRRQSPAAAVEDVLTPLKLSDDDQATLEDRLGDESNCYSLWMVATDGKRSWYLLAVDDRSEETAQDLTFSW